MKGSWINENLDAHYSSGNESSANGMKPPDFLRMLQKMEVNEKYIKIQQAENYSLEELEKLSEEEFAKRFHAENNEEMNILCDIFLKLKSLTLAESYDIDPAISLSNSRELESQEPEDGEQLSTDPNQRKGNKRQPSYLSQFRQFEQSQYLYGPQVTSKISETILYSSKHLPYDPFDFTVPSMSNSLSLSQSQLVSIAQLLKSITIQPESEFSSHCQKPHLFIRLTRKGPADSSKPLSCKVLQKGDKLTIGRHMSNDLPLEGDQISRFQAVIEAKDSQHYFLTDIGSGQGTFVRLKTSQQQQCLILPGSIFKCGATEFKITRMILEESHALLSLRIISGNKKNNFDDFHIQIENSKSCMIGSSTACDISVIDSCMESFHASLISKKGQVHIVDLQSSSGTWIRLSPSKEKSEPYKLLDGQSILISPYILTTSLQL